MTSLACLLTVAFVALAPQDDTWSFTTPGEGLAALEARLVRASDAPRPSVESIRRRPAELEAWVARSRDLGLDYGSMGFVTAIARYGSAGSGRDEASTERRRLACVELLDFVESEGLPESAEVWNDWIGRLANLGFTAALEAGDWKEAARSVVLLLPRSRDPARTLDRVLARVETVGAGKEPVLRAGLASAIVATNRFTLAEKDRQLLRLYGAAPAVPSKAVELPTFTHFSGPALDGGELSTEAFRGKVLLVDYWATWCGPCLREMPNVVEAWRKYEDDGLAILGVSLDRANSEETLRTTMAKYGMDWPQIYDGGYWQSRPARVNGVRSIPATFLLDREGNVIGANLRGAALERAIAKALAAPTPAPGGSVGE